MSYQLGLQPSFANGFARSPGESAYPDLWDRLAYGWAPSLGVQGKTVFDVVQSRRPLVYGTSRTFSWVSTRGGLAIHGDSSDNDAAPSQAIDLSAVTKLSLAFWYSSITYLNSGGRLLVSDVSNSAGNFEIQPDWESGFFRVYVVTVSGAAANGSYFTRPTAGEWHHYVVTYDRLASSQQVPAVYVDGVPQTLTQAQSDTTTAGGFGNTVWSLFASWTGSLGDVFVYPNRLLSQSDAIAFYRGASPLTLRDRKKRVGIPPAAVGGPVFVQSKKNSSNTGSVTVTPTVPTTTGNFLALWVTGVTDGLAAITITTPSGWTALPAGSSTTVGGKWFYKENAGSISSVTVASANGADAIAAFLLEFSGAFTSSSADQNTKNNGTGTSLTTGTTSTTTNASEIWVAGVGTDGGGFGTGSTFSSPTNGFTIADTVTNQGTGGSNNDVISGAALYKIVSSTGTASAGVTASQSGNFQAEIATFKANAGVAFVGDEEGLIYLSRILW